MTEDRGWIEDVTGGSVTRFDRVESGSSRGTWLVDVEIEPTPQLDALLGLARLHARTHGLYSG